MAAGLGQESSKAVLNYGSCESDVDDDNLVMPSSFSCTVPVSVNFNTTDQTLPVSLVPKKLEVPVNDTKFLASSMFEGAAGTSNDSYENYNNQDFSGELKSKIKIRSLKSVPKLILGISETQSHSIHNSYQGVSDRIRTLSKYSSLDNESPSGNLNKEFNLKESRQPSTDCGTEHKVSTSYRLMSLTSNMGVICHSPDIDLSNSEIIEEDFSPVSETTKQLEQQLCFSTSPKSPKMSPRIPKLTRFARLNRLLSSSTDQHAEDLPKEDDTHN